MLSVNSKERVSDDKQLLLTQVSFERYLTKPFIHFYKESVV